MANGFVPLKIEAWPAAQPTSKPPSFLIRTKVCKMSSSSNSSLFISTVPAKQMARELEISAAIINELNRLLYEERAKSEALAAQLADAKAKARRVRRRNQRHKAALRKALTIADERTEYAYDCAAQADRDAIVQREEAEFQETWRQELEHENHELRDMVAEYGSEIESLSARLEKYTHPDGLRSTTVTGVTIPGWGGEPSPVKKVRTSNK
jgi:predicted RNase H-like nuclease (RuvC/YqgF family)